MIARDPVPGEVYRKGSGTLKIESATNGNFRFSWDGPIHVVLPLMVRWDQDWRGPWRKWVVGAELATAPELSESAGVLRGEIAKSQ